MAAERMPDKPSRNLDLIDPPSDADGRHQVDGPGALQESGHMRPALEPRDDLFFVARKQPDGTYAIALTDEGVDTFETALGIANDLGGKTRISSQSTIADIMERTAIREELSRALREDKTGAVHRMRVAVLRRRYQGSENPTGAQKVISRAARVFIVAILALWTLQQFAIAVGDIEAIPGILANLPGDILHLDPGAAFGQVGNRIADAGDHVVVGVMGVCLSFIVAGLIRPFGRIYRRDQLAFGQRFVLRQVSDVLRKADER